MTKMAACHVCKVIVACVEKGGQLLYRDHLAPNDEDMCEGT